MSKKRTVQLLLIDGTATGRIQAKLDNWTGVAYKIPKILLPESGDRKDLKFCGIYFLLGRDDETDERIAYIGQTSARKSGESLRARVAEHGRSGEKAFFNEVVFFATGTDDFGPTELCFLENCFWNLAKTAGRYRVVNSNEPSKGNVTEAKEAELERFVENARILMSTFGHNLLEEKLAKPSGDEPATRKSIDLFLTRSVKGVGLVQAQAEWTDEGIVVKRGSHMATGTRTWVTSGIRSRRDKALAAGDEIPGERNLRALATDELFSSPSSAAMFVIGQSANGRTSWKTADGRTFEELDAQREAVDG